MLTPQDLLNLHSLIVELNGFVDPDNGRTFAITEVNIETDTGQVVSVQWDSDQESFTVQQ